MLDDAALVKWGYRNRLGRLQKVLLVLSVFLGFVPMWFLFRMKLFAGRTMPALAAFGVHCILGGLLAWWLVLVIMKSLALVTENLG